MSEDALREAINNLTRIVQEIKIDVKAVMEDQRKRDSSCIIHEKRIADIELEIQSIQNDSKDRISKGVVAFIAIVTSLISYLGQKFIGHLFK